MDGHWSIGLFGIKYQISIHKRLTGWMKTSSLLILSKIIDPKSSIIIQKPRYQSSLSFSNPWHPSPPEFHQREWRYHPPAFGGSQLLGDDESFEFPAVSMSLLNKKNPLRLGEKAWVKSERKGLWYRTTWFFNKKKGFGHHKKTSLYVHRRPLKSKMRIEICKEFNPEWQWQLSGKFATWFPSHVGY